MCSMKDQKLKARMGLAAVVAVLFGCLGILLVPTDSQAAKATATPTQASPQTSQAVSVVAAPKL
jgi:hypothetical protein